MSNTEIILTKTKGNTNPEDVLEALRKKKKNKFSINYFWSKYIIEKGLNPNVERDYTPMQDKLSVRYFKRLPQYTYRVVIRNYIPTIYTSYSTVIR